jgi:hypothetical protein
LGRPVAKIAPEKPEGIGKDKLAHLKPNAVVFLGISERHCGLGVEFA